MTAGIISAALATPGGLSAAPYAWLPSSDRVVAAYTFAGPPQRGRAAVPLPIAWSHAAGWTLDYTLDTTWPDGQADPILAATVTLGAGVSPGPVTWQGRRLTFWVSGGAAGIAYPATFSVTTALQVMSFAGRLLAF